MTILIVILVILVVAFCVKYLIDSKNYKKNLELIKSVTSQEARVFVSKIAQLGVQIKAKQKFWLFLFLSSILQFFYRQFIWLRKLIL